VPTLRPAWERANRRVPNLAGNAMPEELSPRRIAANVVAPGAIQTDSSAGMIERIEVSGGMSL
jgi:hypothetical protein